MQVDRMRENLHYWIDSEVGRNAICLTTTATIVGAASGLSSVIFREIPNDVCHEISETLLAVALLSGITVGGMVIGTGVSLIFAECFANIADCCEQCAISFRNREARRIALQNRDEGLLKLGEARV